MADTPGNHHAIVQSTASSNMAIVQDKRSPHRPGGCVGILFQLFDWNRRFAKKKLFPKKFLPPVRPPKRVSKKFASDDKMPISKFLLIAGDNTGGLSTTKNHPPEIVQDTPMLAPSLVGRLMGLESIPSAPQKPRMAVDLENPRVSSSARHDLDLDLGDQGKLQLWTQNLHSTVNIDNKLPTAVHFESSSSSPSSLQTNKNVLSRKQHRDKPSSSVKTPKILCKKNSATTNRLMEAAVKIFEPSLQQRNRSRCAVTSADSWQCNYSLEEGIDVSSSSHSIPSESKPLVSGSQSRRLPSSVASAQAKPNVQIRSQENIETKHLQRKKPREEVVPRHSSQAPSVKERVAIGSSNGSKGSSSTRNMNTRVRPGTAPPAFAGVRPETKSKVIERKTSNLAHGKRPNNNNNKPNSARNRSLKSEKSNPATARGTKVQNTCLTSKSGDLKNKNKSNLRKKSSVEGDVKTQICQANNVQLSPSDSRVPPNIGTCFTGDELSALLEQKIRELNSLESMVEDGSSRSTATILEELISALTKGRPMMHHHHEDKIIDRYDCPDESNESPDPSVIDSQWFKPENVKDQEKTDGGVVGLSNSPVSILEVSFSTTDSFLSENLNSTPDYKPDAEFSDSAASNNRAIATNLETISIMYNSNRFPGGNTTLDLEKNPSFVRKVISNIYLLLSLSCGSFPSCYESEDDVESLIVDALDSLLDSSSWTGDMSFPIGRRFLLDYILEYLDRRYGCYFKCSGYKVWEKKRGFLLNSEKISSDVHLDIAKHAAVKNIDAIIDDEMRNLDGEWKGFGVEQETFDAATEIQQEMFEALVEETVEDLFVG